MPKTKWIEVINELRKGPLTKKELQDRGISRRTVYRTLRTLKKAELIEEKKGKYFWYEHSPKRFKSEVDYRNALNHSHNLLEELNSSKISFSCRFSDGKIVMKGLSVEEEDRLTSFLDHLDSGHPSVHDTLIKLLEMEEKRSRREEEAKRQLENEAKVEVEVRDPHALARVIVRSAKHLAMGEPPIYDFEYGIEKGMLRFGAVNMGPEESSREILDYVRNKSRANINLGKELVELNRKLNEKRLEFDKKLIHLRNLVRDGTPLHGSCDLCPVRISVP